jgi:hypothetical protein
MTAEKRRAEPDELCTCGRPASVVFPTDEFGEVGWCGRADGGRRGTCVFCGDVRGHPVGTRCPRYVLRLDQAESVVGAR